MPAAAGGSHRRDGPAAGRASADRPGASRRWWKTAPAAAAPSAPPKSCAARPTATPSWSAIPARTRSPTASSSNLTYKADQLQPVSNMIRIPNIVSAHPIDRHQVDPGADRLYQGQSGQAQLRLLGRRPEPSPHRRLVPAAHRTEDDARAVPRRGPALQAALAGDIQILFDNLYPSLPQVQDGKLTAPRRHHAPSAAARRRTFRPCARARPSSPSSTSRRGSACSCRRPRPPPSSRRSTRRSRRCWTRDDIKKNDRHHGRAAPTRARRSSSPISWQAETTKFADIIKREGLQMDVN